MAKIGITDVASAAGVSTATVSVILNRVRTARVHPKTRERVLRVANELGYVPNPHARGLRLQRSDIIGFVSDRVATTPYAGAMILGAQEASHAAGRLLVALDTGDDAAVERAALTSLLLRRVDGILYAAMYHRTVSVPVLLGSTPTVLVNATSDDRSVSSVVPDETAGVALALSELLNHGHRRIGYVGSLERIPATPMRLRAFRSVMRRSGFTPDAGWIASAKPTSLGGYSAAMTILQRPNRPTALFCFKDTMAVGVYQAARELGLSIPADLSVVGFDNLELIAASVFPGLTTVALPHHEMGVWAANQLVAQITDPGTARRRIKIVGTLHRRESVASPPHR
jgi:LacI family transcriptional regulator